MRNIVSCCLFVRGFSLVVVFRVVLSVTLAVLSVLAVSGSVASHVAFVDLQPLGYFPLLALDAMVDHG